MKRRDGHPTWFDRNPKTTLSAVVLIAIVLLDITITALLKVTGNFEPLYSNARDLESYYRAPHPIYHHTLVPNIDYDKAIWGGRQYTVRTNSLGFKDAEVVSVPLSVNERRVLIIGDSFAEGIGIDYSETFTGLLDKKLGAQGIDVLNASASSYSPVIHYRKIRHLIENVRLSFDELIAFVDISDPSDEALLYRLDARENVISRQPGVYGAYRAGIKDWMTQRSITVGALRSLARNVHYAGRDQQKAINQRNAQWTIDDDLYASYGRAGLELCAQYMTMLKRLLDANGIKLTVVVHPWPDQIYRRDHPSRQNVFWKQWTEEHGALFVDLFPIFMNYSPNSVETIQALFISGDVHWNAAGHKIVADALLGGFP